VGRNWGEEHLKMRARASGDWDDQSWDVASKNTTSPSHNSTPLPSRALASSFLDALSKPTIQSNCSPLLIIRIASHRIMDTPRRL